MFRPERLPEEARSGVSITLCTQQKVDGLARGIDGPVEIIPPLLNLDICLINAIRVIGLREMEATTLVEFGSITLDLPQDGGVIDSAPTFPQQFFDIMVAQGIAEIPPDPADDDLTSKVTPFEECGLVHA
jgi:hypothetical protein